MSRRKGIFTLDSANYEPLISAPLDARSIASFKDDLIDINHWRVKGSTYTYPGMIVSVVSDSSENVGLYMLVREDYTDINNWLKVGAYGSTEIKYFDSADSVFISNKIGSLEKGTKIISNNEVFIIGDNAFPSMEEAASLDLSGKTIYFDNGEYSGFKILSNQVKIIGSGGTVINGTISFNNPSDCCVKNISIKSSFPESVLNESGYLISSELGGSNFIIEDVSCLVESGQGACLGISGPIINLEIRDCEFKSGVFEGTGVTVPTVVLNGCTNAIIEKNYFSGSLKFGNVSNLEFSRNEIEFAFCPCLEISKKMDGLVNIKNNEILGTDENTDVLKVSGISSIGSFFITNNTISYSNVLLNLVNSTLSSELVTKLRDSIQFNTIKNKKSSYYIVVNDEPDTTFLLGAGNNLSHVRYINCGGALQ